MTILRTQRLAARWGALLLVLSGFLHAEDWSQFQGPRRDGTSNETGLRRVWPEQGPEVLWTVELGPGFGGAAVDGDEVFLFDRILSEADVLRCLDLNTGKELWRYAYEAPGRLNYAGSRGVPTVEEQQVYSIGGFGQVCCVDRQTHRLVWRVDLGEVFDTEPPRWGYAQSPLVFEDLLLVTPLSDEHGIVALDKQTGDEVWRSRGLGTSHSTPALLQLNGIPQLLMVTVGRTTSFDPRTGRELWRTGDAPFFGRGNMILADGLLIIQDGFNGVLRLVAPTPAGYQPLAEANLFGITDTKDHELWGPLALSQGRLLMRGKEQLKCVNLRGEGFGD